MKVEGFWPYGRTWAFAGTVAEDATAGTHVCSLVVSPGAGSELLLVSFRIVNGNTATSQTMSAFIDDGTNILFQIIQMADTSALVVRNWPSGIAQVTNTNMFGAQTEPMYGIPVAGSMRIVLQETTAALSVTQAFAITCRVRGSVPTATLSDTVGTPTLTTLSSRTF